jgi:hypothetical protein
MRLTRFLGIILTLYGILHLFGFLTAWNLIEIDALSRTPTLLGTDPPIGVLRDLGVLWLAGTGMFGAAGFGAYTGRRWWKGVAFAGALTSMVCIVLWFHEVWAGIVINLIILGFLVADWYQLGPGQHHANQDDHR